MSPNKDIGQETDGSISPTTIISSDKSLNSFKNNNNIIATKFTLTEFPDKDLIKNIWTHPDIWITQRDEVRNYCDIYKDEGIEIEYIKYYKYGRYFVKNHKIRSSTIMYNAIRSALFKDTELDIDIINCHCNLLLDICECNDFYDVECLKYYCENRDEVINLFNIDKNLIKVYNQNNKTNYDKKDIIKNLITRILYGGSIESWKNEFFIDCEIPEFINSFINEIKTNTNLIIKDKRFKDIIDYETKRRLDKAKKKYGKKFDIQKFEIKTAKLLSVILQEYECLIIMKCFEIAKNNNFTITSYNYDGFQILKKEGANVLIDVINNYNFNMSHNNKVFINFKNIKFIIKPFKNAVNNKDLITLDSDEFEKELFNLSTDYNYKKVYFEKYFAKILNPTMFVERKKKDFVIYKKNDFGIAFSHLFYYEPKKEKPEVLIRKSFIPTWICDEDMKIYNNVDYYPTNSMCPEKTFNLWNEFPILSIRLDETADTSLIHNHIKTLLKNDEKDYEWFLNWLAHIVKFPHKKTGVCVVFYDKNFGTGKSMLAEQILQKIIGINKMIITSKIEKVFGKFANSQGKLLCVLNEASGKDTFELNDIIKEAITGSNVEMEKKGIDAIQIKDYLNYIITTNNLNCIKLEDGDRRFMVFATSDKLKGDVEYFDKLDLVFNDEIIMRKFYEELINRDLSKFNASRDRQENKIMEIMKEHNKDIILEFINYWKQEVKNGNEETIIKKEMKAIDIYKQFKIFYEMCGNNINSRPSLTKFGTRMKTYNDEVSFKRYKSGVKYSIIVE
tara:strand:+ start:3475 stop:5835 length:2361 start_codon:yes stop_codon:yes gene_type:complete